MVPFGRSSTVFNLNTFGLCLPFALTPIISLSDFKSDASQWLKRLQDESDAVVLTQNGRASAVVQSYETFQRQQQALLMLKLLAQGEADIAAGRLIPQEEVFAKLRERFAPDA